jgi:Tfp pilus assembly protein PilF
MSNDQIHNNLGMVLSKLGRLEEAEKSFQKSISINTKNPSALSNYGLVLKKTDRLDEAIKALEQAIEIAPKFVDAFSNLGAIYFERSDLNKAEDYFRQALKIDAHNFNVMNSLAGVLLRKNEDDEALAMIRKALEFSHDSTDVMLNMAKVLLKKDDENGAETAYHRVLEKMPGNIDALVGMGGILSKQGKFDGAKDYFQQVLQIDPKIIAARVGLIDLDPPDIEDEEIKDLENTYEHTEVIEEDKIRIAFCLAKTFEKGGQYNKAFNYLADGNSLKRRSYEYSPEDDHNFFNQIKNSFSEQCFREHAESGFKDKTPIFILGMPRSGTTLTEQILSSHPQVFGAGELPDLKKLVADMCDVDGYEKFSEIAEQLNDDDFAQMGMDYIKGIRARSGAVDRVTDKMPHNFLHVGMIRLMLPNAKIIHCRRNPIDNCLSIFKQDFAGLHKYAYDLGELGSYHLLYQDLMEHWHKVLPGLCWIFSTRIWWQTRKV